MKLTLALAVATATLAVTGGAYSATGITQSFAPIAPTSSVTAPVSSSPEDTATVTEPTPPAQEPATAIAPEQTGGDQPAVADTTADESPTVETPAVTPIAEDEAGVGVGGDTSTFYPENCVFVYEGLPIYLAKFSHECREQQLAAESIVTNAPANISYSTFISANGDGTYSTQVNGFTVAPGGPVPDALISTYSALDKAARS